VSFGLEERGGTLVIDQGDYVAALSALASLVRREFPPGYTLAEIAATWGDGATPEAIEALRRLEAAEPLLGLVD